jgi:hypothetical protein
MKGPGNRRKFVLQREWECPVCCRRVATGGHVVHRACDGHDEGASPVWMKLIKDPGSMGRAGPLQQPGGPNVSE